MTDIYTCCTLHVENIEHLNFPGLWSLFNSFICYYIFPLIIPYILYLLHWHIWHIYELCNLLYLSQRCRMIPIKSDHITRGSHEYVTHAGVTCSLWAGAARASAARASVSVRFSWESWRAPVARWFYARNDWELSINGVREMENTSASADFTLGFIVFR